MNGMVTALMGNSHDEVKLRLRLRLLTLLGFERRVRFIIFIEKRIAHSAFHTWRSEPASMSETNRSRSAARSRLSIA